MKLTDLDFDHPPELIARRPAPEREDARLLHVAARGVLADRRVRDLPELVRPGEVVVLNDTRVRAARIFGRKESGGRVEVVLLARCPEAGPAVWRALVGASRPPRVGARLLLGDDVVAHVAGRCGSAFLLEMGPDAESRLEEIGEPPLPPYLGRRAEPEDRTRYQTVYAREAVAPFGQPGASSAAPTAGLHLTSRLLHALEQRGARVVRLALGVGAGTFLPVQTDRVEDHVMHAEPFAIPEDTAAAVNDARDGGRPVLAVGTTTLRALEASATPSGRVRAVAGTTGLFLVPGCRLRTATRLLTNFHQPRSTLLALVQAFAGRDAMARAMRHAVASGYRLFSYGDATLLERAS